MYETIKALALVKTLGVHTALGVSNVSFGLPQRPLLNRTFLTMAMTAGLTLPIMNPLDQEMMAAVDAFRVLRCYDKDAQEYINRHSTQLPVTKSEKSSMSLHDVILHGFQQEAESAVKKLLEEMQPMDIINTVLIPALNEAGELYEKQKMFLPQLMQCAETSKQAFSILKECFSDRTAEKGVVMMATVEGDIHDIGKNIVKVVVESYGYRVIDLGKDVAVDTVVKAWHKHHPDAIGLSALMTTTLPAMEETIRRLKEDPSICPIWVGGAVLTKAYAQQIHADYYTKDAMETVELLNRIINE